MMSGGNLSDPEHRVGAHFAGQMLVQRELPPTGTMGIVPRLTHPDDVSPCAGSGGDANRRPVL